MSNQNQIEETKSIEIGGQALIEGVMMRGGNYVSIALRGNDGSLLLKNEEIHPLAEKWPVLGWPFIRGVFGLFEILSLGIRSLTYSAGVAAEEEDEELSGTGMFFSLLTAFGFAILLFIVLPTMIAKWIGLDPVTGKILFNTVEGGIRLSVFFLYVVCIALMEDVRRVFQYHGAEHKSVYAYENKDTLDTEHASKYSTLHPRCGTNFLFIVMIISIFVFSIIGKVGIVQQILLRMVLLPVVAGISYEILKFAGKAAKQTGFVSSMMCKLSIPGLQLQKFTTREPDESQVEVALAALKEVKNALDGAPFEDKATYIIKNGVKIPELPNERKMISSVYFLSKLLKDEGLESISAEYREIADHYRENPQEMLVKSQDLMEKYHQDDEILQGNKKELSPKKVRFWGEKKSRLRALVNQVAQEKNIDPQGTPVQ